MVITRFNKEKHGIDIKKILEDGFNTSVSFEDYKENVNDNIYVIESEDKVIATATLHILNKFIHNGNRSGLIEDVAVSKEHRNEGYGELLINHCLSEAKKFNCYKVILNCKDELIPFYEKNGFYKNNNEMRYNFY